MNRQKGQANMCFKKKLKKAFSVQDHSAQVSVCRSHLEGSVFESGQCLGVCQPRLYIIQCMLQELRSILLFHQLATFGKVRLQVCTLSLYLGQQILQATELKIKPGSTDSANQHSKQLYIVCPPPALQAGPSQLQDYPMVHLRPVFPLPHAASWSSVPSSP